MKRLEKKSHMALKLTLVPMVALASFVMMSLPAQADLTCTNIHESKVSYDRECGEVDRLQSELSVLNDEYARYINYLNNTYGSKSNSPPDVVETFNSNTRAFNNRKWQLEQQVAQQLPSCRSAGESYAIFLQMAREQGLDADACLGGNYASPSDPDGNQNGGNQEQNNALNSNNDDSSTSQRCAEYNSKGVYGAYAKTFDDGTEILCHYHSNGNLSQEQIKKNGKSVALTQWYPDRIMKAYSKYVYSADIFRIIYHFDSNEVLTDCVIYDNNNFYKAYNANSEGFSEKCGG